MCHGSPSLFDLVSVNYANSGQAGRIPSFEMICYEDRKASGSEEVHI
jgi:hypothetical protein